MGRHIREYVQNYNVCQQQGLAEASCWKTGALACSHQSLGAGLYGQSHSSAQTQKGNTAFFEQVHQDLSFCPVQGYADAETTTMLFKDNCFRLNLHGWPGKVISDRGDGARCI